MDLALIVMNVGGGSALAITYPLESFEKYRDALIMPESLAKLLLGWELLLVLLKMFLK